MPTVQRNLLAAQYQTTLCTADLWKLVAIGLGNSDASTLDTYLQLFPFLLPVEFIFWMSFYCKEIYTRLAESDI